MLIIISYMHSNGKYFTLVCADAFSFSLSFLGSIYMLSGIFPAASTPFYLIIFTFADKNFVGDFTMFLK